MLLESSQNSRDATETAPAHPQVICAWPLVARNSGLLPRREFSAPRKDNPDDMLHRPFFFSLVLAIVVNCSPVMILAQDIPNLVAAQSPSLIAQRFADGDPSTELDPVLNGLKRALLEEEDGYLVRTLQNFFGEIGTLAATKSGAQGTLAVDRLLQWLTPEGQSFSADAHLAERLTPVIYRLGQDGSAQLRAQLTSQLVAQLNPNFEWLESLLLEWNQIKRGSAEFELAPADLDVLKPNDNSDIRLSVYSLPSYLVTPSEAVNLLDGVVEWDKNRRVVAFSDGANLEALRSCCLGSRVEVIDTYGRDYSPWPRDAFTFARRNSGESVVLLRPNEQTGRTIDSELGRALVQSVGDETMTAVGNLRWVRSPIPFHNGQILFGAGETWISIHSLERRALQILDIESVPVGTFTSAVGVETYVRAIRSAAAELEVLFGRPVRFVHPLPTSGSESELQLAEWRLGGGAGYDLDSLVTILPQMGSLPSTLVGSVTVGNALLGTVSDEALAEWAMRLGLEASVQTIRDALLESHRQKSGLQAFLDSVAHHLASLGHKVRRTPLWVVPHEVSPIGEDFLLGINNAVLEALDGQNRAEGYSTSIPKLDQAGIEAFKWAGYHLQLLPLVVQSVLRNGGYRCSSNHLRESHLIAPGTLQQLTSGRDVRQHSAEDVDTWSWRWAAIE